jgi:hypothetical protein
MDDLLKAYAKKRREEAGAPAEMHPATRRLLQTEAAKLRPKAQNRSESSWFGALWVLWPRYALATGLFVVLGLVTWGFFRFDEQPREMALLDTEPNVPRSEPTDPSEKAEKPAPAAPGVVSESRKESEVRQGIGRQLDSVALSEEASVRLKSVSDESKAKKNVTELTVNESLQKRSEATRPTVTAPPASAPVIAPTLPPEKPAVRRLAAVDAQNTRKLNESSDAAQADGKNVALKYAQTPTLNENTVTSFNRDLSLSDSSSVKPQLDALSTANTVTLQLADSPGAYNVGIAPLGNSRAQELFGLTNTSAGDRFGQSQALTANGPQALIDNYSKLPGLQADSAGGNAQNSQFYRATEAGALGRQNARPPAPQSPSPPAATVSEARQIQVATGAGRFYSEAGAAAQTGQSGTQSRSRFSQVQSTDRVVTLQRAGALSAAVLAEFDLEQTGNRLRVVDADGSVYDGQIVEDAAKADFDDGSKDRARRDSVPATLRQAAPRQSSPAEGAGAADAPAWNFRATGTNRTLQQPVTINGVLYGISTNRAGQAGTSARGLQSQTQQATQQSAIRAQLPVQRIQGRVQVGAGAETQLDAIRRGN